MPTTSAAAKRSSMMAAATGRRASTASKRHSMIINPKDIPTSSSEALDNFFNKTAADQGETATAVHIQKSAVRKVDIIPEELHQKKVTAYSDQRAEMRRR